MSNFDTLNNEAKESKDPLDKLRIYRQICVQAQTNPQFRQTMDVKKFLIDSQEFADIIDQEPKNDKLRIAILGYKVSMMDKWDPFDIETGLPGSEECAVYASQELARRGHKVTLYMNPPDNSIWRSSFSNPRWLPEDFFHLTNNKGYYDFILMWRRFDVDTGRKRSRRVFSWVHDSPNPSRIPKDMQFPSFDGICLLSEHHRKQFLDSWPGFDKVPYIICGNGIVPEQFTEPMRITNPFSIGYYSNYARGLIVLMLIWPEIKKEFPTATLEIYYGRETWGTMPPDQFNFVLDKMNEYKDLGVTECGKVGHIQLASAMKRTSVLAYPCLALSETFCITVVKAQASGMIPVTTRIAALDETVHRDWNHT